MNVYNPNHVRSKNYFLLGAKLILTNNKNEILLLQRSDKISRAHGWDLPGGAVDENESPSDAVVREAFEETGISITDPQILSSELITEHDEPAVIIGFHASVEDPRAVLSWESQDYRWVPFTQVVDFKLPRLHTAILETYLQRKTP